MGSRVRRRKDLGGCGRGTAPGAWKEPFLRRGLQPLARVTPRMSPRLVARRSGRRGPLRRASPESLYQAGAASLEYRRPAEPPRPACGRPAYRPRRDPVSRGEAFPRGGRSPSRPQRVSLRRSGCTVRRSAPMRMVRKVRVRHLDRGVKARGTSGSGGRGPVALGSRGRWPDPQSSGPWLGRCLHDSRKTVGDRGTRGGDPGRRTTCGARVTKRGERGPTLVEVDEATSPFVRGERRDQGRRARARSDAEAVYATAEKLFDDQVRPEAISSRRVPVQARTSL